MKNVTCLIFVLTLLSANLEAQLKTPEAARKPITLKTHGHERVDPYFWLNERKNPEVIKYLEAENAYLKEQMKSTESLQKKLFEETKARIKQTDVSVPYPENGYEYYSRTAEGKQYRTFCRRKSGTENEEVIVDVNELAKGHQFCSVRGLEVTTDTKTLAYGVDVVGRRKYNVHFKDLSSGKMLDDKIENVTGNMAWAEDNKTLFYTRQDPKTLRSFQIYKHTLGTDSKSDKLVYEEKDEEFSCYIGKSRSRKYLMIASIQTLSTEFRYLDATDPSGNSRSCCHVAPTTSIRLITTMAISTSAPMRKPRISS